MTQPIRIGMIDSGVHAEHPHVGGIAPGITIEPEGLSEDFQDRLGHGTAIAALIHWIAPQAELIPVKVFDTTLATNIHRLIRAIDWCLANHIPIINLSLGTSNPAHRDAFLAAVSRVQSAGAVLVSAYEINGQPILPGSLPGVIGVSSDSTCTHEEFRIHEINGKRVFGAPPFPREIPGVPRERNLHGVSFAVAHISAHLARAAHGFQLNPNRDWEQLLISQQGASA